MTEKTFAKIKGGLVAVVASVLLFCGDAWGVGDSPISGLRLTSPANGGYFNFTNLNTVVSSNIVATNVSVSTLTVGGSTITNLFTLATWGAVSGTITNQTDLWGYLSWVAANSNAVQNGTQNWNTAYSWVAANSNIDVVYTNTANFALSISSATNDFGITGMSWNIPSIIRGRIYISDTNIPVFSQTCILEFRDKEARGPANPLWQSTMTLDFQLLNADVPAGSMNVYVADTSPFYANNLLYLTGNNTTAEFVRVASIASSTNMILLYPTVYPHSPVTNGCSRVREFGGFKVFDSTRAKTVWGSLDLSSQTNINVNIDLEHSK